jgi:hypothetical protein
MSVKRGLRVAEIAQLQAIERGKVRAEQLRKAAGAEQITHVLTGWENAAEDMAAAERQADLRTALGVAEPAPSDADRPDAELIDPEDYADETAGLLRDGGEDFEPDDSDEVYRSLVSDD